MNGYLDAAWNIAPDVYAEACSDMVAEWDDQYTYPRPAHIKHAIRRVRESRQGEETLQENREMERIAMTPADARVLLAELAVLGEPKTLTERITYEWAESTLRRVIARDKTPRLAKGDE